MVRIGKLYEYTNTFHHQAIQEWKKAHTYTADLGSNVNLFDVCVSSSSNDISDLLNLGVQQILLISQMCDILAIDHINS